MIHFSPMKRVVLQHVQIIPFDGPNCVIFSHVHFANCVVYFRNETIFFFLAKTWILPRYSTQWSRSFFYFLTHSYWSGCFLHFLWPLHVHKLFNMLFFGLWLSLFFYHFFLFLQDNRNGLRLLFFFDFLGLWFEGSYQFEISKAKIIIKVTVENRKKRKNGFRIFLLVDLVAIPLTLKHYLH